MGVPLCQERVGYVSGETSEMRKLCRRGLPSIWNARNKFYFDKVLQHPKMIVDGANGFLVCVPEVMRNTEE